VSEDRSSTSKSTSVRNIRPAGAEGITDICGAVSSLAYTTLKGQAEQLQAQLTVQIQTGQSELEAAKGSLKLANPTPDETLIALAKTHISDLAAILLQRLLANACRAYRIR
jgi:hypothetical protein